MMWNWHGYDAWWMVKMAFGVLAFCAVVAWVIANVARSNRNTPAASSTKAEQILAERYARGDIDATEYHAHLGDLRESATPALPGP